MGLSNQERRVGIYYAIKRLYGVKKSWESDYHIRDEYDKEKYKEIRDLIDQLWHALFGQQSNSLHWIMGSSSSQAIQNNDPTTPWEMAVVGHLSDVFARIDDDDIFAKPIEKDDSFNALKSLEIENLLTHSRLSGNVCSHIFKIYQWVEQLVYYLRRYPDDEFAKNYESVSVLASNLMGECFTAFSSERIFAQAYVVRQILEHVYQDLYYNYTDVEDRDVVLRVLTKDGAFHHGFNKLMDWEIDPLSQIHIKLVEGKNTLSELDYLRLRLDIALDLCFNLHEYKHLHAKVIAEIKNSPLKKEAAKYQKKLEALTAEFEAKKKEKSEKDKEDWGSRSLNAYGYRGEMKMYDLLEQKQVPKKKPVKTTTKKKTPKKKPVKKTLKKKGVKNAEG
jgi:hypothetical protein